MLEQNYALSTNPRSYLERTLALPSDSATAYNMIQTKLNIIFYIFYYNYK